MMDYMLRGQRIKRIGYYVPLLGTTLLSIKHHMTFAGCYFHAENNSAVLAFPQSLIDVDTNPEMQIPISPVTNQNIPIMFDETEACLASKTKRRKYTVMPTSQLQYLPDSTPHQLSMSVRVKKLTPLAKLPARATEGSAGFDVHASHETVIPAKSQQCVHTGLIMAVPKGMYLRIASRSSLALKGINVIAGVVDNDFRGEIKVILQNTTDKPYSIPYHSSIAQFIFEKNHLPCITVSNNLPKTNRGQGGFGSTDRADKHFISRLKAIAAASRAQTKSTQTSKLIQLNEDPNVSEDPSLQLSSAPVPLIDKNQVPSPVATSPSVLPAQKVNQSLPKSARFSYDFFNQATGFYNNQNFIKYMKDVGKHNVTLKHQDGTSISDEGKYATMRSKRRNTNPSNKKYQYSDIWHVDIGFGPTAAIGGVRYCLMFVDKATRYRRVYPLKNLTSSIPRAIHKFLTDVGQKPKLIRTDFDKKIIGSEAREILDKANIRIESAPPKRQHQNGLVERAWQSAVIMARNWIKSALLPAKYWYYALRRAIEISNISPTKIHGDITTPFEAVYKQKVDFRQLFPMFSTSYIKQETIQGKHKNKWSSQSLKVICVGTCPDSDGLLFYHPNSKSIISCGDNYRFDTYLPAGPQFNEPFDGRMTINTQSSIENIHTSPSHETNSIVYYKTSDEIYHAATVLNQPFDEDDQPYTIQLRHTGNILEIMGDEIYDHNPNDTVPPDTNINPMLPWLQHNSKVTLILPVLGSTPKQGYLQRSDADNEWYFLPGRTKRHTPIHLSNFQTKAMSMYENKKIFQGWKNTRQVHLARQVRITSNVISHMIAARHVSAKELTDVSAPTSLLAHAKMIPKDKQIWDDSYKEEYEGLQSLNTWEVISEEQYKTLKKTCKAHLLPTMAISVIKRDGNGTPSRAKYRIVVLGNLDPHGWEKHECFAPVLTQYELRLLLHLAVEQSCIPKVGDVSQAFCQALLPEEEIYVCKPPPGCPLTPTTAYWKLLKSLYGMRRSPRHWYELAHKILTDIGLTRSPNSPCIYSGILIDGHPPLYLGLYVDDFVFFSKSRETEEMFQHEFAKKVTKVTFDSQLDYFLGIKFECIRHSNKSVTIHMSQAAFSEALLAQHNLHGDNINTVNTPYQSGMPIDKIPNEAYDDTTQKSITHTMQSIVGSLTWLSMSTRPDLSTVTNLLAKHVSSPSMGHVNAAKRVLRYIKGTLTKGITFSTNGNSKLAAFIKFPPPKQPIAITDANWGPQDQSRPKPNTPPQYLELFKTRSLSGFILWGHGPIHWISKRQSLTARSSAEAEIVATDECVKFLLHLRNVCDDLHIQSFIFPEPITVYNDNAACINWAKNMTTKGLRYIQIRENAVREAVSNKVINIQHIAGKVNVADLFTKEDKDTKHFVTIRDILVQDAPKVHYNQQVESPLSLRGVTNTST